MDVDDVRARGDDGVAYGAAVERVDDGRLGAHRPQRVGARTCGSGHLVPACDEHRHEALSKGASGARDEDA
jgi:hypothetical protein